MYSVNVPITSACIECKCTSSAPDLLKSSAPDLLKSSAPDDLLKSSAPDDLLSAKCC